MRAAASLGGNTQASEEAARLIATAEERALHAGRVLAARTQRNARRPNGDDKVAAPLARAVGSRAGRFLRNPVEDYLHRLQQDVVHGRWDALGRAVPLGTVGQRLTVRLPPAFTDGRAPGERLTVEEYLRGLYEGAARELVAAGAVERAAFVLADLLHQPVTAAQTLTGHGLAALAAELLEGRTEELALAARYWRDAGRVDLAVEMLRTRQSFASVVDALVVTDAELASSLQTAWVDDCLARGDVAAAVTAAWPVPPLRAVVLHRVVSWWPRGGRDDGPALGLLAGGAPDTPAPLDVLPTANRERVAATAARGIAALAQRKVASALQPPVFPRHVWASGPAGLLDLRDAVALPDGSLIAALGPGGAILVDGDGATAGRWEGHCDRIVMADHGTIALLEGRSHGDSRHVRRLDLDAHEVVAQWQLTAPSATDTFDGGLFPIIDGTSLTLVDTTSASPKVILREPLSGHRVIAVTRWQASLAVLTAASSGAAGEVDVWAFDQPGFKLVRRQRLVLPRAADVTPGHLALTCLGAVLTAAPGTSGERMRWYDTQGRMTNGQTPTQGWTGLAAAGPYSAVTSCTDDGAVANVLSWRNAVGTRWPGEIVEAVFPDADQTHVRLLGDTLTIHDNTGRALALDLPTGELLVDRTLAI
jgi:hypothetical protein